MKKLEDYIVKAIWNYPSLYYRDTYQKSRRAVLGHLFLTLGAGIEFIDGYFGCPQNEEDFKLNPPDNAKERIINCEPIVSVCPRNPKENPKDIQNEIDSRQRMLDLIEQQNFSEEEKAKAIEDTKPRYCQLNYVLHEKTVSFLKDYDGPAYEIAYEKIKDENPRPPFMAEIYPENPDKYKNLPKTEWKPYPFCFNYLPFWQSNPNSKKYTYENCHEATVEEIAANRNDILPDWREGIVEIYKQALDFFEDDEKYCKDTYFNWINFPNNMLQFLEKNKDKTIEETAKDYGFSDIIFNSKEEIGILSNKRNRQRYIDDCKKIIQAYQ
jgi:hypothetical protein